MKGNCVRRLAELWASLSMPMRRVATAAGVVLVGGLVLLISHRATSGRWGGRPTSQPADVWLRPPIEVQTGKVRPALAYRIVSFHRGRADKRLVRLAAQLGFNGVMIQVEGSTIDGIKQFAQREKQEHLIDFCHKLGMKVWIWVHELSDVPEQWMPDWLGPVTVDNQALWAALDTRYDWMLREVIPDVDGLVLTVVETQIRVTDPGVMLKLAEVLRRNCDKYNKSLMVRTFVWYPEEFAGVMEAVNKLPPDTLIMSKCVPQDWQMRGAFAAEIGQVGGRPQIIEYDVAGEYFLRDRVANCMPELLKRHFDHGLKNNVSGICVRVDRDDSSVLDEPSEVNLWALGMLSAGATDDLEEIWGAWAVNRFGKEAAAGVVAALKPAQEVVAELLSIGPFSFGDTRKFPPLGDEEIFGQNWQNWWWDASYAPLRQKAEEGEADFTRQVQDAKTKARQQAELCLLNLDLVRERLAPADYAILRTRLLGNKIQLDFRAPMAMAVLHYRRMFYAKNEAERQAMDQAMQADLAQLRMAAYPEYGPPDEIKHLDRTWKVGVPEGIQRQAIYRWAWQMDLLRQGEDPRLTWHGRPVKANAYGPQWLWGRDKTLSAP